MSVFKKLKLMLLVLIATLCAQPAWAENIEKELVILTWAEYLPNAMIEKFEKRFNAQIRQVNFLSESERDQLLATSKNKQAFDLTIITRRTIPNYIALNWISNIDKGQLKHLDNFGKKWLWQQAGSDLVYAIPYTWGTIGFAYRKSQLKGTPDSWQTLFQPGKDIKGHISMLDDVNDLVGTGLKALGYSSNSTDPKQLDEVSKLLLKHKSSVSNYAFHLAGPKHPLMLGSDIISMTYSGDAMQLIEMNKDIDYVVPKEGTLLWEDMFVMLKHAPNRDLAYKFLNFISEPEISALISESLLFATPNQKALELLPKELRNNPVVYPPETVINNSELHAVTDPATLLRYSKLLNRLLH